MPNGSRLNYYRKRKKKRKLERIYRRRGLLEDLHRFNENYSKLLVTTRRSFYNDTIQNNSGDQRALFTLLNMLLHRADEAQLPVHNNLDELTKRFADFFN